MIPFNSNLSMLARELSFNSYTLCLDIGCGVGVELKVLGQNSVHAVGIELNRSEILVAQKRCVNLPINFVVGDAHHLPFKGNVFGGAICLHLLEHLNSPEIVLDDVYRILKPTSMLLTEVPNGFSLNEYISGLIYKLRGKDIRNVHKHRFTEKSFEDLFQHSWVMKQKCRHGFIGPVLVNVMRWIFFSILVHRNGKVSAEFFSQRTSSLTRAPLLPKIAQVIDSFLSSKFPSKAVCFTYLYEKC